MSSLSLFMVTPVTVIEFPTIMPATGMIYLGVKGNTLKATSTNMVTAVPCSNWYLQGHQIYIHFLSTEIQDRYQKIYTKSRILFKTLRHHEEYKSYDISYKLESPWLHLSQKKQKMWVYPLLYLEEYVWLKSGVKEDNVANKVNE